MGNKGRLIVLDGLDGSGKSTQFELVRAYLSEHNIAVKAISFPDYDQPSSALVKQYLNGTFSKNAGGVNAYAASSFYAVDRYASFKLFWEESYNSGGLILASRYVSSNAIHQMVKLEKHEWDGYLEWLDDYEHGRLGLPRADRVIFLDMPVEASQRLLIERYGGDAEKRDIHEADTDYLHSCRDAALYAAKRLEWDIIPCGSGETAFSVNTIFEKIIDIVMRYKGE